MSMRSTPTPSGSPNESDRSETRSEATFAEPTAESGPELSDLESRSRTDGELTVPEHLPADDLERQDVSTASTAEPRVPKTTSEIHQRKLRERRYEWKLNVPLLVGTVATAAAVTGLAAASYFYHSNRTAETFLTRADQSAADGDYEAESVWLSRYLKMWPDDQGARLRAALAANKAADDASDDQWAGAVDSARAKLANALALSGGLDEDQSEELRRQLIRRLVQSGLYSLRSNAGAYPLRQAEQQILSLDAQPNDPFAMKALALALQGQVSASIYDKRDPDSHDRQAEFWAWLADQNPAYVVMQAVSANPNDLQLSGEFLELARNQPESFVVPQSVATSNGQTESADDEGERPPAESELNQAVRATLDQLRNNPDPRAVLILSNYARATGDEETADKLLVSAANESAQRLAADGDATNSTVSNFKRAIPPSLRLERELPRDYWNYLCVLEAARRVSSKVTSTVSQVADTGSVADGNSDADDAELAAGWYELLLDYDSPEVGDMLRAATFLEAGVLEARRENLDEAVAVWQRGAEEVPDENLEMAGRIAQAKALRLDDAESLPEARKALERFDQEIENKSQSLLRATTSQMSQARRNAVGKAIDLARWQARLIRAQLLLAEADPSEQSQQELIGILDEALNSTVDVSPLERARVAIRLAEQYETLGQRERAAETLTKAANLVPADERLRIQTARAWTLAGHQGQADKHWKMIASSSSPLVQLSAAQAELEKQIAKVPGERDFTGLRLTTQRIAKALNSLDEQVAGNESATRLLEELRQLQRILELSVPPVGVAYEAFVTSERMLGELLEFSDRFPDSARVQDFASRRLAVAGFSEQAQGTLERLAQIRGSESPEYVRANAVVEAIGGDGAQAAQGIIEHLKKHPSSDANVDAELAKLAMTCAARSGELELAYEALQMIPEPERTVQDLFALHELALRLPEGGREDAKQWWQALKDLEGDHGTYWRLIDVRQTVQHLLNSDGAISPDNEELKSAQSNLNDVLVFRPQWGMAMAVQGWIYSLVGKSEKAVEQMRDAIAVGDRQQLTRQLLWEQLIGLGRMEEAEKEILRASMVFDGATDAYGSRQIDSASTRQNLSQVLTAAQDAAQRRPEKTPFLAVAKIAAMLADMADATEESDTTDQLTGAELEKVARSAIADAESATTDGDIALQAVRLDIEIQFGDSDSIRKQLEVVLSNGIDDADRAMVAARAHLALGETDPAIAQLERADQLRSSWRTKRALARLYRIQDRLDDQIQVLREALSEFPKTPQVRSELAVALMARGGGDVDWQELSELLADADGASLNQFQYAVLLGVKGDRNQQLQALERLETIALEQPEFEHDASLVRAFVLIRLAKTETPSGEGEDSQPSPVDENARQAFLDQAEQILKRLASVEEPKVGDQFRYAGFLLDYGDQDDLPKVKELLDQLHSTPGGAIAALRIGIVYANKAGDRSSVAQWIEQWADETKSDEAVADEGGVDAVAGSTLLKLGFAEESVKWLAEAYKFNPKTLKYYIVALSKSGQYAKAAETAAQRYKSEGDAESAMLMVEAMLSIKPSEVSPQHVELLKQAYKKYPNDAPLLESIATWAFQHGDVRDAIERYRRVLELDPTRIRALNNLAMAYTQLPGRAVDGIKPIQQAIKLAGENPELLDTLGTVYLKAGKLTEAIDAFAAAIEKSSNPRFSFHMFLALVAQGKIDQAREMWSAIDVDAIDLDALTPEEREISSALQRDLDAALDDLIRNRQQL
ncbi:hypothetical protein FYK55_05250 [Roseiconus nitratireducens]|uniref:Tetratricopeptide repeat protein n=1 Tax=Roseiconus nitratireducens TaxID=2605748 RepID=A0A5M6DFW2_9BACT|nr:hypothetical protein [Roseiconus nitratireducens]KAA5546293.1 hypothetical protein FYK55_05250 [Roseiconus nitratireducens]